MSGKQTDFDILMEQGIDIRGRTIYLQGEIEASSIYKFQRLVRWLDKTTGEITIILDSEGGDVNLGLAVYDVLKNRDNEITIKVEGVAMSMGSIILQAGDKRTMTKHSRIMIHRGQMSADGNLTDVDRAIQETKRLDKLCIDIYLERLQEKDPNFKRSKIDKMMDFDTYISADEALAIGLIDEIDA